MSKMNKGNKVAFTLVVLCVLMIFAQLIWLEWFPKYYFGSASLKDVLENEIIIYALMMLVIILVISVILRVFFNNKI